MSKENYRVLIDVILLFERKAVELIGVLAAKYDLDLDDPHPFDKLISRRNDLWKGDLPEDWGYQFHGDACQFENMVTGQLVDVKINRRGHYGTISNFYLFKFIETTAELAYVLNDIDTPELLYTMLDDMEKLSLIVDLDEAPFSTRILNRT